MAHRSYDIYYPALSGKCVPTPGTEDGGLTLRDQEGSQRVSRLRLSRVQEDEKGEFDKVTQEQEAVPF